MGTQATTQNIQNLNDRSDFEDFDGAWRQVDERLRTLVRVVYGLIGLTRLGEHPVEVDRFAAYLDRPANEALALLKEQSGALFTAQVRDGLIALDLARPEALRRRHLRIGERRIAMSGCAPDLFQIAAVIDTPFQVEDTCPTTGVPIRVDFAPPDRRGDLIDAVDPADTVVALDPRLLGQASAMTSEQIDTALCVQMPFFAGADAAQTWLAGHPARRVLPVRQMAQLEIIGYVRDVLRPRLATHVMTRGEETSMTTTGTTVDTGSGHITPDFWEQGFAHVPSLLTEDEVTRYRTAALNAIQQQSSDDKDFGTGIVSTTDAWEANPILRELALHPRIGALAERLAGMALRVWGGEVLVKPPHGNATTGLHDDLTFALLDSRLTFNVWIALVDVPVECGCLTFLPRSHRRDGPERVALSEQLNDPDDYLFTHWPELRWNPRVTVPLRAGDATVHHSRTAHSAGANTTDTARVSFLLTYTDADATYRPLPGHDPLPLTPGQTLPDERYPRIGA